MPYTAVAIAGSILLQTPAPPPGSDAPVVDCAANVPDETRDLASKRYKAGAAAIDKARWPEAETALAEAARLDPLLAIARYGLGQAYMEQRRFSAAAREFAAARQAFRCTRALSDDERKTLEAQIIEVRDVLRSEDQRRLAELSVRWKEMNGDSRTAADRARTVRFIEQKLHAMERALRSGDPSPIGVTLALGTALFQTNDLPAAEREFRAVLARDPKSGDAHHNLALVCVLTGRVDEAEREMQAAIKAGVPAHPRLKEEIERRRKDAR